MAQPTDSLEQGISETNSLAPNRASEPTAQHGSGAVDTADPLVIAERDNTKAFANTPPAPPPEPLPPELREELNDALAADGAVTGAPTVSGGQVGSNMDGGGTISNPEVTNSKLGDPEV